MVRTLGVVMAISNNGLVSFHLKFVLGCVMFATLFHLVIVDVLVIVAAVRWIDMC